MYRCQRYNRDNRANKPRSQSKCGNCGYQHTRGKCPAYRQSCLKCGLTGHFAPVCRSKNTEQKVNSAVIINTIHHCKTSDTLPRIPILVGTGFAPNPQVIQIIPDTGAGVTVAGLVHLKSLGIKKKHLMLPDHKLSHVAEGTIAVIGKCKLAFEYNQTISIEEVYFVNGISRFFLSLHACKNLYVIPLQLMGEIQPLQLLRNKTHPYRLSPPRKTYPNYVPG